MVVNTEIHFNDESVFTEGPDERITGVFGEFITKSQGNSENICFREMYIKKKNLVWITYALCPLVKMEPGAEGVSGLS